MSFLASLLAKMNNNDNDLPFKNNRYAFMAYVAEISSSQEDLLRVCRFVGEPEVSQDNIGSHDGVHLEPPSLPNTDGSSVDPIPIIILSDDDEDEEESIKELVANSRTAAPTVTRTQDRSPAESQSKIDFF